MKGEKESLKGKKIREPLSSRYACYLLTRVFPPRGLHTVFVHVKRCIVAFEFFDSTIKMTPFTTGSDEVPGSDKKGSRFRLNK